MASATASINQLLWRDDWTKEHPDEAWTQQMDTQLKDKARALAVDAMQVTDLSCHETVCRGFLSFRRVIDADRLLSSKRGTTVNYEYQLLNPDSDGNAENAGNKKYNYELLAHRERPAHFPHAASSPTSEPSKVAQDEHSAPE